MWVVVIKQQGENKVRFGFNKSNDALSFVETCMECGEIGTEIAIKEVEED